MGSDEYEAGKRAGEISGMMSAQENILKNHHERISSNEKSIKTLEKVAYSLVGIIGFVQLFPNVKGIFS